MRYRSLLIGEFNVPRLDFHEQHADWKRRFGQSLEQEKAFLWQFMERWAKVLTQETDDAERRYKQLRAFHLLMWGYLIGERKPAGAVMQIANFYELKRAECFRFRTRVQIIAGHGCTASERVDGLSVPLEDALREQPIPYASCSRPLGCICCYGFHGERDVDDRLIPK